MVDVPDELYNQLVGKAQIANFISPIWDDPQLGTEAKALVKKKYPQVQIADYDIRQEIDQRFNAERKSRDDEKRQRADAESRQNLDNTRKKIKQDYGFTDDGMKELEDFMVERNVGDYEVAAGYRAARNPKVSDANHHDGFWHHNKQDTFGEISKDPEGWARGEILKSLYNDEAKTKGWR